MIDPTGGQLTDLPNKNYQKFFDKFNEIDTLPPKEWKVVNIISYFCKKYQSTYKTSYKFKFNSSSPSKCFEVFQIKKLSNLLTSDPTLLKEYIDWIYDNKVIKAKRRITSISFLTREEYMQEYKFNVLLNQNNNNTIGRSTALPDKFKNVFLPAGYKISTYGELSFLHHMTDKPSALSQAFENAKLLGLNVSILDKVL